MSETRFLSTVLFGGYERASVDKRFEFLMTQIFSLKNELRETKLLLAEYKKGTEPEAAAEAVLSGERAKLTQVQVQHETMSKKSRALEEENKVQSAELETLRAQLAEAKEQIADLSAKLHALEADSSAAALSTVFIEAQKSAELLKQTAKREAEDLERNARKLADNVLAEANNTAAKIVYDAEVHAANTEAESQNQAAQTDAAKENFRASMAADIQQAADTVQQILHAFEAFRTDGEARLAQSQQMLQDAQAALTADGIPQFRMPEQIAAKLPDEPEYQPVDHNYEQTEAEPEKSKVNEELERLRQMAESLTGKKSGADETDSPAETPAESGQPASDADAAPAPEKKPGKPFPDLAALAAQAAALKNGTKK